MAHTPAHNGCRNASRTRSQSRKQSNTSLSATTSQLPVQADKSYTRLQCYSNRAMLHSQTWVQLMELPLLLNSSQAPWASLHFFLQESRSFAHSAEERTERLQSCQTSTEGHNSNIHTTDEDFLVEINNNAICSPSLL